METVTPNEEGSLNIQNDYFNNARRSRTRITVFLTNGQRITGFIRSFDRFTVILETRNGDQMIFKHAITSVGNALAMEMDRRGGRPPRPGMGDRGGDQRPHGGPRPQGPPGGGAPHHGGPPPREGGPRPDAETRMRGTSGPQGKTFGNFMDLSAVKKGASGEAPPSEEAPAAPAAPAAAPSAPGPAAAGGGEAETGADRHDP
jgi:host factor-I protein